MERLFGSQLPAAAELVIGFTTTPSMHGRNATNKRWDKLTQLSEKEQALTERQSKPWKAHHGRPNSWMENIGESVVLWIGCIISSNQCEIRRKLKNHRQNSLSSQEWNDRTNLGRTKWLWRRIQEIWNSEPS
jgi:hypothetical protein